MKSPWYTKKWMVVLLHLIAWTLLFTLPKLLIPSYDGHDKSKDLPKAFNESVFIIAIDFTWIILFYLNSLVFIPKTVYRKKYYAYGLINIVAYFSIILEIWLIFFLFGNSDHFNWRMHLVYTFFVFLFIQASSTAYQMIRDRIQADNLHKEKERENLKTELSFLRSQVSPHFMFNVLNNMVALARKNSEQLEPSLIKLSSLMRYMLYEADEDQVSLEREVEYLQSYIDLQLQRFGNKVSVKMNFSEIDADYSIEPMLLIPFVENAFKHGVSGIDDAIIEIELKAINNQLSFIVRNHFNDLLEEIKDKTSGIGLANVKRRLLLLYASNHQLQINDANHYFTVSLQLNFHK
jgi:LytS/YehU family sensor histidine kinase